MTTFVEDSDSDSSTSSSCSSSPSTNRDNILLEECSIGYFAGYLAKKCLDQFKCTNCELNLTKIDRDLNDKSLLLLLHKSYDNFCPTQGLKAPSDQLIKIVNIYLEVFQKSKVPKKFYFNLKKNLIKKLICNFQTSETQNVFSIICIL